MKEFLDLGTPIYRHSLEKSDPNEATAVELESGLLKIMKASDEDEIDEPLTLVRFWPHRKNGGINPKFELGHHFENSLANLGIIIKGDITEKSVTTFIGNIIGESPKGLLRKYNRQPKNFTWNGFKIERVKTPYKGQNNNPRECIQYNLVRNEF